MTTHLTALKWGTFTGLANLLWLYVGYWIGLHTNGPIIFQIFMLGWLAINIVGFIVGLRITRRSSEQWSYGRVFVAGLWMSLMTAILAAVAQAGYWTVIHPEWPEVMTQQTRDYFEAQGAPADIVEARVAEAKKGFSFGRYVVQSTASALFLGIF
ncbi:MAG: DUF4199 domain-containing protein, partial [Verrucomicrobiota bacterium]